MPECAHALLVDLNTASGGCTHPLVQISTYYARDHIL